jgi:sec-independent protein translocase protein TatA
MFGGLGIYELAIIVGIAVLLFGASRIPDVARSLGEGVREFKKAGKDVVGDITSKDDAKKNSDKS